MRCIRSKEIPTRMFLFPCDYLSIITTDIGCCWDWITRFLIIWISAGCDLHVVQTPERTPLSQRKSVWRPPPFVSVNRLDYFNITSTARGNYIHLSFCFSWDSPPFLVKALWFLDRQSTSHWGRTDTGSVVQYSARHRKLPKNGNNYHNKSAFISLDRLFLIFPRKHTSHGCLYSAYICSDRHTQAQPLQSHICKLLVSNYHGDISFD